MHLLILKVLKYFYLLAIIQYYALKHGDSQNLLTFCFFQSKILILYCSLRKQDYPDSNILFVFQKLKSYFNCNIYHANNFYHHMSEQISIVTYIVQSTLAYIIKTTQNIIKTNKFVKSNLFYYVINRQHDTLHNLVSQIQFRPRENVDHEDNQPFPLNQDNLMGTNQIEPNIKKHTDRDSIKNSKNTMYNSKNSNHAAKKEPYKSISKNLDQQQIGEQLLHIQKLRDYKQKQREQQLKSPKDTQRPKIKLIKGQSYIFDYQGNMEKGKERKIQKFNQTLLQTKIDEQRRRQSKLQEKSNKYAIKLNRQIRNRTETKGQIQFLGQQKRELMINNLKLSNSKTKIVFDGTNITNTQQQYSFDNQIQRRKSSVQQTLQKQTQNNQQISMNMSLARSIQMNFQKQKTRFNTQVSQRKRRQRINIQSEALKKVLMTEPEELYSQLPKNKIKGSIASRAIETKFNDPDLIRIRQKLNIKRNDQKLPKILNRYSNIEKDILRDLRKRSKFGL